MMKWLALYISFAVVGLWSPVTPQARALALPVPPTFETTTRHVSIVSAAPVQPLVPATAARVCSAQEVGEWLQQPWCNVLPLQVVAADTHAVRIAVIAELPAVQLAVQRTVTELRAPALKAPLPVAPAVAEAPVVPAGTAPRSSVWTYDVGTVQQRQNIVYVFSGWSASVVLRC